MIQIYKGGLKVAGKSGIGQAVLHQETILKAAGMDVTDKWSDGAEVIHLNTVFPDTVLAAIRARLLGKHIVYYGHSTMEDFKNSFKGSNLLAPLFKRWICFCYNLGDVIITPTAYSKAILSGYRLKRPLVAVSNGIDTESFKPDAARRQAFRNKYQIGAEEKVVISVGHFMKRKGILDFIALARRFPKVRFLWFGYTASQLVPTDIQKAMADAPKNLCFAGFIPQESLKDAYCGADVFAFLSLEETEGIVVLEALASGTPALVRDIPVYADWLTDGDNAVKAQDMDGFVTGLTRLLEDSAFANSLRVAGRQTALGKNFQAVGKQMKAIYAKTGLMNT